MLKVDLGCGDNKPEGYLGVDVCPGRYVDIVADLTKRFPFDDSSLDCVRAHCCLEHLPDRLHSMNEIWRVCKHGASVDLLLPSTDGRGAFQDPTHVSYWNINSFFYYDIDRVDYLTLCHKYGFRGGFAIQRLENLEIADHVIYVKADLIAVKDHPLVQKFCQVGNSSVPSFLDSIIKF